jgi:hypothetical protein
MAIYTVHVPRGLKDAVERADRTTFVRDGFNFWAFLFGPLFLLRHRAWLAAAAWVVLVVAGAWFAHEVRLPFGIRLLILMLIEFFVGLEGNNLRRAALERRGFDFADVVAADRRETGERSFFDAHGDHASVPGPQAPPPRHRQPPASQEVIGSFPIHGA